MSHYNLYEHLNLDPTHSGEELAAQLQPRLAELRAADRDLSDPELHEVQTAYNIFSDPAKKELYDTRLADDTRSPIVIRDLVRLAGTSEHVPTRSHAAGMTRRVRRPAPDLGPRPRVGVLLKNAPRPARVTVYLGSALALLGFIVTGYLALTLAIYGASGRGVESAQYVDLGSIFAEVDLALMFQAVFTSFVGWFGITAFGIYLTMTALRASSPVSWVSVVAMSVLMILWMVGIPDISLFIALVRIVALVIVLVALAMLLLPVTRVWFEGLIEVEEPVEPEV
ncbi:hypothetical protein [Corynebacterium renale]|uniref:hypothetical protein n=1 Tax=Corynebacterium renale TaxID=1724 RepID=UPI000E030003|nr:hypothetical protein [Corynebacterium renale]STD00035.1 Uncharacterised protein [Corynebacterium renale]